MDKLQGTSNTSLGSADALFFTCRNGNMTLAVLLKLCTPSSHFYPIWTIAWMTGTYKTRRLGWVMVWVVKHQVVTFQAIRCGHSCLLLHLDAAYLLHLVCHKPTLFLDEYAYCLKDIQHLPVSLATIHHTLECAGLSVKHVQKLASE